jgi:hypothetical protein
MDCSFSETQFVFGILHELLNNHWSTKQGWLPPMFPTQRKERDLGYDVHIKGCVRALFFQFKVPEKKIKSNSKYWLTYNAPYYVFKIWPDNLTHQHNNLIKLANTNKRNRVYYCSPGFNTDEEFNRYYKNEDIANNSIYVPCHGLKTIHGADKHVISYTIKPKREFHMHSDEFRIVGLDYQGFEIDINESEKYNSIGECLLSITEAIDMGDASCDVYQNLRESLESDSYEGIKDVYNGISEYLMMQENTCFVILGEEQ